MPTITTHSRTRVNGIAQHGDVKRATIASVLAAVDGLRDLRKSLRSGTDSDATVWVQIDDRRLDTADIMGIQMATTEAERRQEAKTLLGQ